MARQQHGFNYEHSIIEKEGLVKSEGYTNQKDAYLIVGNRSIPVQIKCQKISGEICLASYERNRSVSEDFILHLGYYQGITTNIVKESTYYISAKVWRDHCSYSGHEVMLSELKLITKLKEDNKRWREFMKKHQAIWNSFPDRFIRLRGKRNHAQKRLQLAIPKADRSSLDLFFLESSFSDIKKQFEDIRAEPNAMIGTDRYAQKSSLDKFYTRPLVAEKIIEKFMAGICSDISRVKIILEPSAGNGSFSKQFDNWMILSKMKVIAIDLEPGDPSIKIADFLTADLSSEINEYTVVVGNPPFGKQASGAVNFFNRCALYKNVHYIGFILPASFKKESIQNRLDLNFSLIYEDDLDPDSFLLYQDSEVQEYAVPCVFQIWKRTVAPRNKAQKYYPNERYTFVSNSFDANIAFRRVGVYAGKCMLIEEDEKYSNTSHYFISTEFDPEFICQSINNIEWATNDTVGPRSISKNILIRELNKIIDNVDL